MHLPHVAGQRIWAGPLKLTKLRALTAAIAIAIGITAGTTVAVPALASSSGTVTVTYGSWDCSQGGSPVIAFMSIDQGGQVSWQTGDSATTWSILNTRVQINATLYCKRPWYQGGSYYEYNFYAYRWFSFSGQHTYV
jgi:hypothetical protein